MSLIRVAFLLTAFIVASVSFGAAEVPEQLDLRLSALQYPFEVKTLDVMMRGQSYQMAYMDVAAQGTQRGVVLLLHGKNFSSEYWANTLEGLTRAGYRTIAVDQIGFGKSDKPDVAYHFDDLVRHTIALLDALQLAKVTLVANSMGGMLGVRLAHLHPERVEALVLENPLGLEDYSSIPPQTNETLLQLEMAQTKESFSKFLHGYFPVWQDTFQRYVELYAAIKAGPDYEAFSRASVRSYQMIAEHPVVDEFKEIRVPVLLIIGQLDRTVFGKRFAAPEITQAMGRFPELGRRAATLFPIAELVAIDDAGHVPHLERPERFMQVLLKYLNPAHP